MEWHAPVQVADETEIARGLEQAFLDQVQGAIHIPGIEDLQRRLDLALGHDADPHADIGNAIDVDLVAEIQRADIQRSDLGMRIGSRIGSLDGSHRRNTARRSFDDDVRLGMDQLDSPIEAGHVRRQGTRCVPGMHVHNCRTGLRARLRLLGNFLWRDRVILANAPSASRCNGNDDLFLHVQALRVDG